MTIHDEERVTRAFETLDLDTLDFGAVAGAARTHGTRIRRRRHLVAGLGAAAAVAALAGAGYALAPGGGDGSTGPGFAAEPTTTPTLEPTPTSDPTTPPEDTVSPYLDPVVQSAPGGVPAWLDATGWGAPVGQPFVLDEKAYFVNLEDQDRSASLNWRSASYWSEKYADCGDYGRKVADTTMAGVPADVCADQGEHIVIAEPQDGRFLTLATSGLTADQATELASYVVRK